jgi:hypothetical protein
MDTSDVNRVLRDPFLQPFLSPDFDVSAHRVVTGVALLDT